jgi:hypothetical protein
MPHLMFRPFQSLTTAWLIALSICRAAAPTLAEGRSHWAFLPLTKAPAPAVKQTAWPKNDIDRFILAKLEAAGIKPSAEADRATLIRRVTLDLTGLPPAPEEVEAACWRARAMASAGGGTGWIWRVMRTRAAFTTISTGLMPGSTATTSSAASMKTNRMRDSSPSRSPGTRWMARMSRR